MELENRKPYYFTEKGISKIEEMRDAIYMGYWCGKTKDGGWANRPLDVFYQPNPDVDAGHSHYFGLIVQDDRLLITGADSCFSEPMQGIVEDDVVYVSRFRHDFVRTPSGSSIDGGRDYTKTSVPVDTVEVVVNGATFEFRSNEDSVDESEEFQSNMDNTNTAVD